MLNKKGVEGFDESKKDLKVVIGIIFVSGYNCVPRKRMYCVNSEGVHDELITPAMSAKRFEAILKHIHLCDNHNLDEALRKDPQGHYMRSGPTQRIMCGK